MTGADGRFQFDRLPLGAYGIAVEHSDGATSLGQSVTRVELQETGVLPDLRLWFHPVAKASGQVLDTEGRPYAGAIVALLRPVWNDGVYLLRAFGSVETDEQGFYTMSVASGEYYLQVAADREGAFPPQYYPDAVRAEDAVPIVLREGVELGGLDVLLSASKHRRVRFELDLGEQPPGFPEPLSEYLSDGASPIVARVRQVGQRFGVGDLPLALELLEEGAWRTGPLGPGEYELLIRYADEVVRRVATARELDSPQVNPVSRLRFVLDPAEGTEDASDLDLGDVSPIARGTVTGRIVLSGDRADFADGGLPPIYMADSAFYLGGHSVDASAADGSFRQDFVPAGLLRVYVDETLLPDGWYVESIRHGSRDVLVNGLEVGGGGAAGLEIVLADSPGSIAGVVRMTDSQLVPGARVVLAPPPFRRGPMAQFPNAEADMWGAFVLEDVPPGEYRLLALDAAGRPTINPYWQSPDFLRQYELRGELITVDPGARLTINPEAIPLVD
jgi:hypothetical protein